MIVGQKPNIIMTSILGVDGWIFILIKRFIQKYKQKKSRDKKRLKSSPSLVDYSATKL